MDELRSQTALEFSFRRAGKLVLLGDHAALTEAAKLCALKRQYGCDVTGRYLCRGCRN